MKKINIEGKHNIDKIEGRKPQRANVDYKEPGIKYQPILINKYYLNELNNLNEKKYIETELKKKLNSYKQQDCKKQIHDNNTIISFDQTIEKLVISKLKCYYCKKKMKVLFQLSRDPSQWTLERLNNNINHTNNNTVISCLACNLERRVKNSDAFHFTKNLSITHIE